MPFTQKLFLKRRCILNVFWLGSRTMVRAKEETNPRIIVWLYLCMERFINIHMNEENSRNRFWFQTLWYLIDELWSVYPRSCLSLVFRSKFNLPDDNSALLHTILQIPKSKLHFLWKALNSRNKLHTWKITGKSSSVNRDSGNSLKKELILS